MHKAVAEKACSSAGEAKVMAVGEARGTAVDSAGGRAPSVGEVGELILGVASGR